MMESTARTVVAGYAMWVATYLEPWGVDECMSIWTLLKRFWVSLGVLLILVLHYSYSGMKGCVESS
jgi:hypothetical protein